MWSNVVLMNLDSRRVQWLKGPVDGVEPRAEGPSRDVQRRRSGGIASDSV